MNTNKTTANRKAYKKPATKSVNNAPSTPAHILNMGRMLKNNANLRRRVALRLIATLESENIIPKNDSNYINFHAEKYGVYSCGLTTEYPYTSKEFLYALIDACQDFANDCGALISDILDKENISLPVRTPNPNENSHD